jgi:hypothetical protein
MEKLILNNGDELQGHILETESRLFVYLKGISLADAFSLLIDPENTKVIRAERYGEKTTVRGYKKLYSISDENGQICAALKKN